MWFASRIDTGEAEHVTGPTSKNTAAALLGLLVAACSGLKPEPESLSPQSVSQVTLEDSEFEEYVVTQDEEPLQEEPLPTAVTEEVEQPPAQDAIVVDDLIIEHDHTVTVIEDKDAAVAEPELTLAESARAARQRRSVAEQTQIVITDKNLAEHATGQLTVIESTAKVITNESLEADSKEEELAREEAYWRDRGYEIRLAWKEATEEIEELEADVFNLRMRFYAEDDPFYRDAQIKPAWDHAIEELNRTREEVDLRQEELGEFLEEGRVAGALPGWLREGIELEPVQPADEEMGISEPGEPDSMETIIGDPTIAPDPGGGGA